MLLPKQKSRLVLASLALAALPLTAVAQTAPAGYVAARTITVAADAENRVAPNRVTLQVGIQEKAPTIAEAQKKTNEQLKTLERVAKELGIPSDKIQTSYSSTQPVYRWESKTNKRIFEGYTVNHQITVLLDKPDQLAVLMEKLTAGGVDEINNVSYGLQDEQEAKTAAMKKAASNARTKAEQVASAMGEKLGKLISLQESGTNFQPIAMPMMARGMKADAMMMEAAPPSPPAGGIAINSNVQATFALQD